MVVLVALAAIGGIRQLGVAFERDVQGAGGSHAAARIAPGLAPRPSVGAQAGLASWARRVFSRGAEVAEAGKTTKRLLPNTRFVVEVNVNAGVMPSVGTGIGFVRENDRAIGRNGLYAQMATGWTVGATKKFKSYRPELNQARGAMTKEFGLFSFDDPVKGINTMLELPVPLATWVPGGIIPGLGVAEHAGRPGVILSVQMPFTILPVVGPHVANFLNHAIPDGLPASSVLKRFAAVGSLRLGVVTTVYNPHLSGVVTRVNALARWFDPRLQRFVGALKGARKWVFSSPKVWRARIADLPARIRNVVRRGTSAETSARDIGVDGLRSELETSQLEGLQRNASELSQ